MKNEIEVTENMQKVTEQMKLDDIEENPNIVNDYFICDCCGQNKCLAGSILYGNYRLCNDCVLLAEVGFELKKINNIEQLIDAMEDKRLEADCQFLNDEQHKTEN